MLSNQTSSIQRRRQLHRRQNSLEVPTLVNQLPAQHQRTQRQHRRGLSLDQSTNYPSGHLSPLQEQEPTVSTTNSGHSTPQHIMQEARQHRPAQPGHYQDMERQQLFAQLQQQNAQAQLQQQLMQQQAMRQEIAPPEQAIKHLNDHIRSFYETYGTYVSGNVSQTPVMNNPCAVPATVMAQRPVTPTNPHRFLLTPPMTDRSVRVDRGRFDVAPMPMNHSNVPIVTVEQPTQDYYQDQCGSEYGGGSSSYQSSLADPLSPCRSPAKQYSSSMPILYEEASSRGSSQVPLTQEQMMLHAHSGRQDLGIFFPDSPMRPPMSPREMILNNMDVDASIEDTGISAEEVQAYISEQDPADSKWTCLFPECGKKFGRKENIRSHVQTHLGDRQFKCNHCGKCFVRQHDLKRHAKIHSGDKPHKCPCGNGFARQDALTRHRQRGVCEGALPGFERREVKRGRPRKNRPDMADRLEKATRARKLDARRGSEATNYASSTSSASERGYPDTPPNTFDAEDNAFTTFNDVDGQFDAFIKAAYRDTPPTSPITASTSPTKTVENYEQGTSSFDFAQGVSPAALSTHSSPPASYNASPELPQQAQQQSQNANDGFGDTLFDFGAIETQSTLGADPFSPAAESSSSSSDFDNTYEQLGCGKETFMGSEGLLDFSNDQNQFFANSLDAWLASN